MTSPPQRRGIREMYQLVKIAVQIIKAKVFRKRIPIAVSIHVTNKCNLRCSYCYANVEDRFSKNVEDFTTQELKAYIKEMKQLGTRWIILLGGEPLLRDDIGELIRFIKHEGIFCELVTNGILIEKKIDDIKEIDLLCVSLDGDKNTNDKLRGNGTYEKVIKGLEIASKYHLKIRIHAVLSRYNANRDNINHLAGLARKYRATFGYSTPIIDAEPGTSRIPFLLERDELQSFLNELKSFKSKGYPVYNTQAALNKAIAWEHDPYSTRNDIIEGNRRNGKDSKCFAGHRFVYIDSEGYVYPCIKMGIKQGLNVRDVGFKEAFEHLKTHSCRGCAYLQYIESNDIIDLKRNGVILGMNTFLGGKK